MASSPADRPDAATPSPRAFALQEAIACWNQGYEALAQGDLDRVHGLLAIADDSLTALGDPTSDTAVEAHLRHEAISARGRLEHVMRAGLAALGDELAKTRRGAKALRGYSDPTRALGGSIERQA
jgi:hypothetical protein